MEQSLPFWKFYPVEWNKGDITLCTLSAQGLFTNICSFYWMRLGDITLKQINRKFPNNENLLKELINEEILRVMEDGHVRIHFLDEQLLAMGQTTSKEPVKTMSRTKYKKDKNKDKEKIYIRARTRNKIPPDIKDVQDYCEERKSKIDPERWYDYYQSNGWMVGKTKMKDWQASIRTWERNLEQNKQSSKYKTSMGTRSTTKHKHRYRKPDEEM